MLKQVYKFLDENKEIKYKEFSSKLTKTQYEIYGVRIPKIRKFAIHMAKNCNLDLFLSENSNIFEVVLLQGLTIAYKDISLVEKLQYLDKYILKIDDWSICDILASTIKSTDQKLLDKCLLWLKSDKEFVVRFAIVLLKINFAKIMPKKIVEILSKITLSHYYVEMAIAWCLQEIAVYDYPLILDTFQTNLFTCSVIRKTKQKIRDSLREKNV